MEQTSLPKWTIALAVAIAIILVLISNSKARNEGYN